MRGASSRERMHLAAVKAWSEGRSPEAALAWEAILTDWPTDALAFRLRPGRLSVPRPVALDPRLGGARPARLGSRQSADELRPRRLRVRARGVGRARPRPRTPAARLSPAIRATPGRRMRSRMSWRPRAAGRRASPFSGRRGPTGAHAHFMAGHNGWHLALFLIEQGRLKEVLADYDRFAAPKLADDMTLDRVDAASLLWRLELAGADVGDRWGPVARGVDGPCRRSRARLQRPALRARRRALAESGRSRAGSAGRSTPTSGMARATTGWSRPRSAGASSTACIAYAAGDWGRAIDAILPVRFETFRIGGSHAQRDIINRTLIAAAERAGDRALVKTLRDERGRRPNSSAH